MMETSLKQKLKKVLEKELKDYSNLKNALEVERYNYATILGSLEYIDYAIPLFGLAKEISQSAEEIYNRLAKTLKAEIPCETEFINGYMNIKLENQILSDALKSNTDYESQHNRLDIALVVTSYDASTNLACQLIKECLQLSGYGVKVKKPMPNEATSTSQYKSDNDTDMHRLIRALPGIVEDPDSKAMYILLNDEPHALRSLNGGWYALAFLLNAVKQGTEENRKVLVLGPSDKNQILRNIFPELSPLDIDVHAKHLDESFRGTPHKLVTEAALMFKDAQINSLNLKQRRGLLYALDFQYEVSEAVNSGNLKRLLGELITLLRQQPVANVSRNK